MLSTRNFGLLLACCTVSWLCTDLQGQAATKSPFTEQQVKSLELETVNENLESAKKRQEMLRQEIEALDRDVGAINRALIESAKRGQQLEDQVTASEERLAALVERQANLLQSLDGKKELMGDVLAALQRMGTNPPPAILVQPEDALSSVRSAILLGAVIPQIKTETSILLSELTSLREISEAVKREKANLMRDLNALAEDETRLSLLVEEKNQLAAQNRDDLVDERNRAIELAAEADSLKELISKLETQIASATAAAQAAARADERRRLQEIKRLELARKQWESGKVENHKNSDFSVNYNPKRIEPAIAFSKARGTLLRPVSGTDLHTYGDTIMEKWKSPNVAMLTRPNARVRSPTDGWVIYAGPFRSYGQILILNAGEGYQMILSGLSQVNVQTGRFVLAGEPVGRMGLTRYAAVLPTDMGSKKPVLTVELRKDGKPIDPSPWWAVRKQASNQIDPKRGT